MRRVIKITRQDTGKVKLIFIDSISSITKDTAVSTSLDKTSISIYHGYVNKCIIPMDIDKVDDLYNNIENFILRSNETELEIII